MKRKIMPYICAALGLLSALFCFSPQEALATTYPYRKAITITGTGSALSNHQIKVNLNTANGIAANTIYWTATTKSSDIKFSKSTSYNDANWTLADELSASHWFNDLTLNSTANTVMNQTNSEIWVKVPSIAASGTTTIYMYYGGGSGAANASDPAATFDFYDNFDNNNNWTVDASTVNYSVGVVSGYARCETYSNNTVSTKSYTYKTRNALGGSASTLGITYKYAMQKQNTGLNGWIGSCDPNTFALKSSLQTINGGNLTWTQATVNNGTSWTAVGTDKLAIFTQSDQYQTTYWMKGRLDDVYVYRAPQPTVSVAVPTLSSWNLNMNTGVVTLNYSEAMDASTIVATNFTIQNAAPATLWRTLTGGTVSSTDSATITITLNSADLEAIKNTANLAKASGNSYLRFARTTETDMLGIAIAAVADGSAVPVTTYTADTTAPTFSAAMTVNNSVQPNTVTLVASEPLVESLAETLTNWTVKNNAGTITYSLASAVLGADAKTVTLTLNAVDSANSATFITNADMTAHIKVTPSANIKDMAATGNAYAAGVVTEAGGTLTQDSTAPTFSAAMTVNNSVQPNTVTIVASEKISKTLAETLTNWTITNNGATITYSLASASLNGDSKTVTLTLAAVVSNNTATFITNADANAHIKVTPSANIKDVAGVAYAAGVVTGAGETLTQDSTAPTSVSVTSIAENPDSAYQYVSGANTIYYNTAGTTASFIVNGTAADAQTGIWKINFPALAGFSTGGTAADDTSSPYAGNYTWTATSTQSAAANITAYNFAGLTTPGAFTVTKDITAPTGGSLSYTDSGTGSSGSVYPASSVSIAWTTGTDAASGIASRVIQRAEATFTDDAEGFFGSFATLPDAGATNPGASPYTDSTVTKGKAYKYQYKVTDNVSNASDWTTSSVARFGIKVTNPNGGESWTYGISLTPAVTWTCTSSGSSAVANVKIYLCKDGGAAAPGTPAASCALLGGGQKPSTPASFNYQPGSLDEEIKGTYRIWILDAANSAIYDKTNADFSIKGSLSLVAPDPNQSSPAIEWTMGTLQTIQWNSQGQMSGMKLDYSLNSGPYDQPIIASTTDDGSHPWTVPLDPSSTVRIKVSDVGDATVFSASNYDFIIKGVKLSIPNTAVTWTVGTQYNITWTYAGTIANVKLEYSTDGGTNYNEIVSPVATSDLSYPWTIPGDALGSQTKIRVSSTASPTIIKDASDTNFTVNGIRVLSPDGGETWTVGTSYPITWTTLGLSGNIKLEYSTNGGANYSQVVGATSIPASDLSYSWAVPGEAIGTQIRIRASSVTTPSILDVSSSNFTVNGLKLVAPNGGGTWNAGTQQNITWSTQGTITPIKLEYSIDGGATYVVDPINPSVANSGSSGSFAWTIPLEAISNQLRVKISSVNTSSITDASNSDTIIKGVRLTAPNTAVTWTVSDQKSITWTYAGTIPNVKLEYYNGTTWTTVAESESPVNDGIIANASNDTSFTWTIPDSVGTGRKVRVSDSTDSTLIDASDADFTIKGVLTLTSFTDSGLKVKTGETWSVNWDTTGTIANVRLDYSTDSGQNYTLIESPVTNDGSYDWTIPLVVTTTAKIKISDVNGLATEDSSDNNFEISGLTLSSPDGNETWTVGTNHDITWTWGGFGATSFVLDYSTDGGSTYPNSITIRYPTSGTTTTGLYSGWEVPDAIGTQLKVRVARSSFTSTTYDVSNANFNIVAPVITGVTLTAPGGVNGLFVGDLASVTWTFIGKLKGGTTIEYSTNGTNWTLCDGIDSQNGLTNTLTSFNWTIPANAVGSATRLRIKDLDVNRSVSMGTSGNYTIAAPTVTISVPGVSTFWTFGGANQNITWTTNTNTANVRISYSKDGSNYKDMVNWTTTGLGYTTATNNGTYNWTIANDIGSATIKIVDASRPTISATASLDIVGAVTLTAPSVSGIGLVAGDAYTVTWTSVGTFTPVRLQFSPNGTSWYEMPYVSGTSALNSYTEIANSSPYSWTVPNASSSSAKVRIYDPSYSNRVISTSANAFEVGGVPTLTITAPTNVPSWRVGSANTISWTASSNVNDNIEVSYQLPPDGATWSVIDSAKLKNDSITWTVPQGALTSTSSSWTTQIRVRDLTRLTTAMTNTPTVVILPPSLTAGSIPSVLTVGNNQAITWTQSGDVGANNSGNLRLVYSTDGTNFKHPTTGVAYNASNSSTYVTAAASSGTYTWAVPDTATAGSTCVFRIIDDTRPAVVSDDSNTFRIIHGAATVTTPSGAETWLTGDTNRSVSWTYLGNIGNIKLEYSTNDSTWTVISGASSLSPSVGGTAWSTSTPNTAGSGTYNWPAVPDSISDTVKVKITATDSAVATSGSSANNFYIKGSFTTPNPPASGVSWTLGGTETITWTTTGTVSKVKLYYTTGSTWTIMNTTANWSLANNGTGAATNYSWVIPTNVTPTATATAKVKVVDANDSVVEKESAAFKLIGKFTDVTVPSEVEVGVASTVSWTTTGNIATKRLTYSLDGTNWRNMAGVLTTDAAYTATTVSGNSYSWTVPDTINNTAECLVRVADNADAANVYANSNAFKIKGRLSAVNIGSTSSESYTIGTTTNITWTTLGSTIDTVNLQYTSNGTDWKNMAGGTNPVATSVTAASYTWTIPDDVSSTAKVKVYDPRNSDVNATSANNFSIKGTVALVTPNGAEVWPLGSRQNVTWSVTAGSSSITNVKLQYSTVGLSNNSSDWKDMVNKAGGTATTAPSSGASGTYSWTVPDDYSTSSRVRIYEENSLSNTDNSDTNFEIGVPVYTVLQPGSSNDWLGANGLTKGDTATITWTSVGKKVGQVRLEYSTDNFVSGAQAWTIVDTTNDGSYETFNPQENCAITSSACARIRISELGVTGRPVAANLSDYFDINDAATITVTGPASGATLIAGKNYNITWSKTGYLSDTLALAYSLDSGATWNDINTAAPNRGTYSWTLPDFHTLPPAYYSDQTTAKVRVRDTTRQLEGVTAWTFTLAIPTITLSQPNGGEVWAVGDVAPITWTYSGSIIGPLTLQYDTSGTIGAGAVAINNISNTGTFNWTVSSPVSSTVKFRIKDFPRQNSFDDSNTTVNIISAPAITVTAPTDASEQVVGGSTLVSWTIRGLAVSEVKLDCWDDADSDNAVDAGETVYTITSSNISRGTSDTASANSGQYTGSATWAVPTSVVFGNNYKVRVRGYKSDGTTLAATGVSNGHFRIKGGYEFRDETDSSTAFSASTDWKAKTTHNIKWLNKGSSSTIKLEYQAATTTDGLSSATWTTINSAFTNNPDANSISTYSWIVPDPHLTLYPTQPPAQYYARLRLTDTSDSSITQTSSSFKISYYTVTWKVTDYDYGTALENLTVSATGGGITYWNVASDALLFDTGTKVFTRRFPYATIDTSWLKEAYIGRTDSNRLVNADLTATQLLESVASSQQEFKVWSKFSYNEDTDTLEANCWLEKKGTLVLGTDPDLGSPSGAYVVIFDLVNNVQTAVATLTSATADANGSFWFTRTNATVARASGGLGLVAGRTYFTKAGVWYRSREYSSGNSFDVSIAKKLKEAVAAIQTEVTGVKAAVSTEAVSTRAKVATEAASTRTDVAAVKTETASILTATGTESLPTKITEVKTQVVEQVKPHVKSAILNRETSAKQGDKVTMRYRTNTGLTPTLNVYSPKDVLLVSSKSMTEVGTTGVYEYDVTFQSSWGKGDFTIICSEATQGTVDALVITVKEADIEDVSSSVAAVLGATSGAGKLKEVADTLNTQFNVIDKLLTDISKNISGKMGAAGAGRLGVVQGGIGGGAAGGGEGVSGDMGTVYSQLSEISKAIKKMGGTRGVDLEKLYQVSKDKKGDINYLKNKAEELKATMQLNQKMLENVAKKPVVQTWFEFK